MSTSPLETPETKRRRSEDSNSSRPSEHDSERQQERSNGRDSSKDFREPHSPRDSRNSEDRDSHDRDTHFNSERPELDPRRLYVANLSEITREVDLEEVFNKYGKIKDVKIISDQLTGRSRGYAFVTFEKSEDGAAAQKNLDKKLELDGKVITVEVARGSGERKPRERFPPPYEGGRRRSPPPMRGYEHRDDRDRRDRPPYPPYDDYYSRRERIPPPRYDYPPFGVPPDFPVGGPAPFGKEDRYWRGRDYRPPPPSYGRRDERDYRPYPPPPPLPYPPHDDYYRRGPPPRDWDRDRERDRERLDPRDRDWEKERPRDQHRDPRDRERDPHYHSDRDRHGSFREEPRDRDWPRDRPPSDWDSRKRPRDEDMDREDRRRIERETPREPKKEERADPHDRRR